MVDSCRTCITSSPVDEGYQPGDVWVLMQLRWKPYTSRLAHPFLFLEHSAQGALPRFVATSSLPFPVLMLASFTSVYSVSISFLCTIEGPIFVPQHTQLLSPSRIASCADRHKPVHLAVPAALLHLLLYSCTNCGIGLHT